MIQKPKNEVTVIDSALAKRVLRVVGAGLSSGIGSPIPGKMCVEAAVCYAMGQDHDDEPSCVAASVRDFKIGLNDLLWASNKTRARGLRRVAVAQLGSDTLAVDKMFNKKLLFRFARDVFPPVLRRFARTLREEEARAVLLKLAEKLEQVKSLRAVKTILEHEPIHELVSFYDRLESFDFPAKNIENKQEFISYLHSACNLFIQELDLAVQGYNGNPVETINYITDAVEQLYSGKSCDELQDRIKSRAAECAVQVLRELNSEGSQYLYLCGGDHINQPEL